MKFQFDPNIEYQQDAIEAVTRTFEGADRLETDFELVSEDGVIANGLQLTEDELLENVQDVQTDEELQTGAPVPVSDELESMDFAVEMETGTGKTYVYLRTAFELFEKYGLRKFIIVVPSVAIRKGVIKSFEMMREHFAHLYDNVPYRYYEYDSSNLSRVRQFVASSDIEFMVMTLASFNKDTNIFNRQQDRLMGQSPLELVQQTNPVLILDEPQNMEGEAGKEAIESLNPLCKLRYSATHRDTYNLVYRFTPVDAYNHGYVKQIEVASVVEDHDRNRAYVECKSVDAKKTVVSAKLKIYVDGSSGPVPKTRTVREGDDLYEKTGLGAYEGWVVESLDAGYGEIRFQNGKVLSEGDEIGPDYEAIGRVQIATTIEEHMRKAHALRERGIKVLSLFFIDEVANYTDDEGYIRQCFMEEYNRLREVEAEWAEPYRDRPPGEVQGSYFSEYKSENYMEDDEDAYQLIMKDKERLLSFEEPTEFIFSHSALREGWDNPNVFQICTLNRTISTIRKRQEIGRGMRLAVDQSGSRVFDEQVNRLTVVANQSYAEYVEQLQQEYIDDVGLDSEEEAPKPKNARKRQTVELEKGYELDPDFQELWSKVAQKTRYRVQFDSDRLVEECASLVADIDVQPIKIKATTAVVEKMEDGGELETAVKGASEYESNGLPGGVPNLTKRIAEETTLTRQTVRRILEEAGNLESALENPGEYIEKASAKINMGKRRLLVDGVQYVEMDDSYEMSLFQDLEAYEDNLIPIEKSIYDHVIYDSYVERGFAEALDDMDAVTLFIKLPDWFTVTTPVGEYNPDWAVMYEDRNQYGEVKDRLALVRETKGTTEFDDLRENEKMKVKCARKHFGTVGVDYEVVKDEETFRESVDT